MHQISRMYGPNINPELNIERNRPPAQADISALERYSTRHYSTVSRNNPPIYPSSEGSGSHWDLMKLRVPTNLAVN